MAAALGEMALSDRFTGCNSGRSAEQDKMSKILLRAPLIAPPPPPHLPAGV